MVTHTLIGARILSGGSSEVVTLAERIAMSHHERWDGTGYPHRLRKETIPIEARIVAAADVLDALSHPRPYRDAWPLEAVVRMIELGAGSHFDPRIVSALLTCIAREPLLTVARSSLSRAVA
jgi:putative two-component system response regulator